MLWGGPVAASYILWGQGRKAPFCILQNYYGAPKSGVAILPEWSSFKVQDTAFI